MAPTTKAFRTVPALGSWALPAAAIILVAGSLLFWACVGLVWLATHQPPQQPIVIWMPHAAGSSAADETNSAQLQPANVPRDR
jgi:hypothetical protein